MTPLLVEKQTRVTSLTGVGREGKKTKPRLKSLQVMKSTRVRLTPFVSKPQSLYDSMSP